MRRSVEDGELYENGPQVAAAESAPQKRAYHSPKLTRWGSVEETTRATGGNGTDGTTAYTGGT